MRLSLFLLCLLCGCALLQGQPVIQTHELGGLKMNYLTTVAPVTNLWFVKAKPGKSAQALRHVNDHSRAVQHLKHLDLFVVAPRNPARLQTLLDRLAADEAAQFVEVDRLVAVVAPPVEFWPNDPLLINQWAVPSLSLAKAWGITTGSPELIVAVIDTGIDYLHPDLIPNLYTDASGGHGYECFNGLLKPGGMDNNGHGTHVAGTIGAVGNNAVGISGVTLRVKLASFKFLGSSGTGFLSDALLLLDKIAELKRSGVNIRVANNSWGGTGHSPAIAAAMQTLEDLGILSVCAAGNNGHNLDVYPFTPAGEANLGIISVQAMQEDNSIASFSNFGIIGTDIAAPGVNILSTVTTNRLWDIDDPSGYLRLNGTSMAAPQVSGLAALLFAQQPGLTIGQARNQLLHPGSYESLAQTFLSSSGGRPNAYRMLTNTSVPDNHTPAIQSLHCTDVVGGSNATITMTATDADGDLLTPLIVNATDNHYFPTAQVSTEANIFAFTVTKRIVAGVSDRRGGSAGAEGFITIRRNPAIPLQTYYPSLVITKTNPVGNGVINGSFQYRLEVTNNPVEWRMVLCGPNFLNWQANWISTEMFNTAEMYFYGEGTTNSTYQAFMFVRNAELTHKRTDRVRLQLGSDTRPFPDVSLTLERTEGAAPFSVNYTVRNHTDLNGANRFFISAEGNYKYASGATMTGTLLFTNVGVFEVTYGCQNAQNNWDLNLAPVSVLAPGTAAPRLRITWDNASAGQQLEQSDDFTQWADVPGATLPPVLIQPTGGKQFYRVRQP